MFTQGHRLLASDPDKDVQSVRGCTSGVKAEALASIIDDRKALLDGVLGCGMGGWVGVCSTVGGSIGDGVFFGPDGQHTICIRAHPLTSTGRLQYKHNITSPLHLFMFQLRLS